MRQTFKRILAALLCMVLVFTSVELPVRAEPGDGKITVTLPTDGGLTYTDENGTPISSQLDLDYKSKPQQSFKILNVPNDKTIKSVGSKTTKKYLKTNVQYDSNGDIYTVRIRDGINRYNLPETANLDINFVNTADSTFRFDDINQAVENLTLKNIYSDEPVTIADHSATLSNAIPCSLTVTVPKSKVLKVYKHFKDEDGGEGENGDLLDFAGNREIDGDRASYTYELGRIFDDCDSIKIEAEDGYLIRFEGWDDSNIRSVSSCTQGFDEDHNPFYETDINISEMGQPNITALPCTSGKALYIVVQPYGSLPIEVTATEGTGTVEYVCFDEEDADGAVYRITPTSDMVVSFAHRESTVTVNTGEGISNLEIISTTSPDIDVAGDQKSISCNGYGNLKVAFDVAKGRLPVFLVDYDRYGEDGENHTYDGYLVQKRTELGDGSIRYECSLYDFPNVEDSINCLITGIRITAPEAAAMTFHLENCLVRDMEGEYKNGDTKLVPKGTAYNLFSSIDPNDGCVVRSVKVNGVELEWDEDDHPITIDGDVTVEVVATPKQNYTATFDKPDTVKLEWFKEIDRYNFVPDNSIALVDNKVELAEATNYYFRLRMAQGYQLDSIENAFKVKSKYTTEIYYFVHLEKDTTVTIKTKADEDFCNAIRFVDSDGKQTFEAVAKCQVPGAGMYGNGGVAYIPETQFTFSIGGAASYDIEKIELIDGSNVKELKPDKDGIYTITFDDTFGGAKTVKVYAVDNHVHTAGTEWKSDAENHWHVCSCGEVMDKAAHILTDGACSVCGYTEHVHTAGTEWKSDAENHWHVCSCGEVMDKAAHTYTDGVCICGAKEPHVHQTGAWVYDAKSHWHICSCGEIADKAPHVINGGTCVCGYEEPESGGSEINADIEDDANEYQTVNENDAIVIVASDVSVGAATAVYTGRPVTPKPKVVTGGKTLKEGKDYRVVYSNNVNAGKAIVTVMGVDSYVGKVDKEFTITGKAMSGLKAVTKSVEAGKPIKDAIHVFDGSYELKEGVDYTYDAVTAVKGNNSITLRSVSGSGSNYTDDGGAKALTVKVTGIELNADKGEKLISDAVITLEADPAEISNWKTENGVLTTIFDGKAKKPKVTVTLDGNTLSASNYKLTYSNNKNAGTAYVTVKGKGLYKGQSTATFEIKNGEVFTAVVNSNKPLVYGAKLLTPSVAVKNAADKKLKNNKDYTLTYVSNINAGYGYVVITGIGNYAGLKKTYSFKIQKQDIVKASIKIKNSKDITLKYAKKTLKEGLDYEVTVTPSEKASGKMKVTITGRGNFDETTSYSKDNVKP